MHHRYRYSVDPASDTTAANVLRFVAHGKTVIEIGAGPDSIARALVDLNKARLTAVESDPECIECLKVFCERVIQGDLDDPAWPDALGDARFDAVVIADVLEHLHDPWTVLRQASEPLHEDGCQGKRLICGFCQPASKFGSSLRNGRCPFRIYGLYQATS